MPVTDNSAAAPAHSGDNKSSSEAATATATAAETFRRLHPRTYLSRFLAERIRPDGREPSDSRDLSVNVGSISTADGSALVRLGATTVVCGVKAEIAEPDIDVPNAGFLVPNLDLPALCSPKFKPGPPADDAQVLSDRLADALFSADVVPLSSLCIHPGKSAWVLYVDATCINYDGNVFDAALLAMVAALKNTRLPKATYNEETGQTTCSRHDRSPLQITRTPVACSFGVFDSTHILADPSAFEEALLDASLTIVLLLDDNTTDANAKSGMGASSILSIVQGGLLNLSPQPGTGSGSGERIESNAVLSRCIEAAKQRRDELRELLVDVL